MKNGSFEKPVSVLLFGGVGCFILSFFAMGLAPWTTLRKDNSPQLLRANPYLLENGEPSSIGRGRKIYIAEACWHCHPQFVRPIGGETFRYGPVSQAWESRFDVPHTFGTRRLGPDLSRTAGRHTDDWHYAHLFNPRSTVPLSIMPGYPWYFDRTGEKPVPKQQAKDLVAYLQYLGKAYKEEVEKMVYPQAIKIARAPEMTAPDLPRGRQLFAENCSGCHGPSGSGAGRAHEFLAPAAPGFKQRFIIPEAIYEILNSGVKGTAMPSFREMTEKDLWALSHYVSDLGKLVLEQSSSKKPVVVGQSGRQVFQRMCIVCHGSGGAGDGIAASALRPRPKDLTRRLFAREEFYRILQTGIPGSSMAAFDLPESERAALFVYLSEIFWGRDQAANGAGAGVEK